MHVFSFLMLSVMAMAQSFSNLRSKWFVVSSDSVLLDTLIIIPQSLSVKHNDAFLKDSLFSINHADAKVIWNKFFLQSHTGDSVLISYRVFPILFSKSYSKRSKEIIQQYYGGQYNPSLYKSDGDKTEDLFKLEGITKNGSISRGISFGNNQDVFVNSTLNLQLAGKLSDNVDILAAITDENIPVQPEGNTQQLQDFGAPGVTPQLGLCQSTFGAKLGDTFAQAIAARRLHLAFEPGDISAQRFQLVHLV